MSRLIDADGFEFVMPAKAGIQENEALALLRLLDSGSRAARRNDESTDSSLLQRKLESRHLSQSAALRRRKPFHVFNQRTNLLIVENSLIRRHER